VYESFYKLSAKPFRLSPDPRFFFHSRGHKRALSYLRYGMRAGEGFIVITGDIGTGKTTLVNALFDLLEREQVAAAQVVTTQLEADELLQMVAAAFGLSFEGLGKAALIKRLEDFFRACAEEGKRALLVVDEVQNLPRAALEELRMLSNLQWQNRPLLQSFLLGQREFRATLRSPGFEQLRQRVIAAYHLRPLDVEETRGYIVHRLETAGWSGDPEFVPEVFPRIHEFTGGVPRRINTLCDRLLLLGALEERHRIDAEALETVAEDLAEEQSGPPTGSTSAGADDRRGEVAPSPRDVVSRPRRGSVAPAVEPAPHGPASEEDAAEAMRREIAELRAMVIGMVKSGRRDVD
jgi:putative secretion ATPase (PEP-CTERM system associated)